MVCSEFKKFVSITRWSERQEIRLPPNHMYSYHLLPFVNFCSLILETSPTHVHWLPSPFSSSPQLLNIVESVFLFHYQLRVSRMYNEGVICCMATVNLTTLKNISESVHVQWVEKPWYNHSNVCSKNAL